MALLIGGIEALGLLADKLGLEGGFWSVVGDLNDDLANFGFVVIGVFVAELGGLRARSIAGRATTGWSRACGPERAGATTPRR